MGTVSRGFRGWRRPGAELPPGQYLVEDFPVLSAGPTPGPRPRRLGVHHRQPDRDPAALGLGGPPGLPSEPPTVDLHCVPHWSKLATPWEGVSLDTCWRAWRPAPASPWPSRTAATRTNLPLEDLTDDKAWIAFRYDGQDLEPILAGRRGGWCPTGTCGRAPTGSGGPAAGPDEPGFWASLGYHNYGDPWREQRFWGD